MGAAQTKNVKFIPAESPKALAQKKNKKKLLHIPKVQDKKSENEGFDLGSADEKIDKTEDKDQKLTD